MASNLTIHREEILSIIRKSPVPVNAASIHEEVKERINLATVYRALKFLEDHNLAEGFTILCKSTGTVRFYTEKSRNHNHYFHCEKCHRFSVFGACKLKDSIRNFEKDTENTVYEHTLYLTGICRDCKSEISQSHFKGH
jgi:Fur family ferric uptake transcriptional regulator